MEKDEIMQEVETPVEPVAPKKNRAKIGVVNCDLLNLREEADADSDILCVMSMNDPVTILGEDKNFYNVMYNGVVGYCMKKFINVK